MTSTVAIMQPYLFPYLGYFQLAAAVDEFWLLDTVQFIRRGWMNRNNLWFNDCKTLFTIPVVAGSRDQTVLEKSYHTDEAPKASLKLAKTMRQAYAKAANVETAAQLVEDFAQHLERSSVAADFTSATEFALQRCFDVIGLTTPIKRISSLELDQNLGGQDRIIAACQSIGAQNYVNMIGGRDLYDAGRFAAVGLRLHFIEPTLPPYDQGHDGFEPGLSILDVIAHVPPKDIRKMLDAAQVTPA